MELGTADIQLLYGPTLWIAGVAVPAQETKAPAPIETPVEKPIEKIASAQETPPVVTHPQWQYQPGAVLAAVVPLPHLQDPTLRELLHKMCAAVGVPPAQLNLLPAPFVEDAQLMHAHTRFVLIFGQEIYPSANETISMQDIEIYRLPYLAQLLHDTVAKRHAWELMKQFKDRIYERPV